jgi:hypothetical protein
MVNSVKNRKTPIVQSGIQKLPLAKNTAALAMSYLLGRKIKAVVNQAYMTLDLRETIQRQMFLGAYEPTESGWIRECLGRGDTFIDVGANFGHYATLAASRWDLKDKYLHLSRVRLQIGSWKRRSQRPTLQILCWRSRPLEKQMAASPCFFRLPDH